jgi:hypothetical protein
MGMLIMFMISMQNILRQKYNIKEIKSQKMESLKDPNGINPNTNHITVQAPIKKMPIMHKRRVMPHVSLLTCHAHAQLL